MTSRPVFEIQQIGRVSRGEGVEILIDEPFRPALKDLGSFTHVIVLWWVHGLADEEHRSVLQTEPPYAPGRTTGVFATRSPERPNPIAMTTCKILDVDEQAGVVRVGDIDAVDGTPVLDLKAYFPVCDRVRDAAIPDWLEGWPEWMPDEGIGLEG